MGGNDVLNASRLIFENGTITSLNQFRSYTDRFNLQSNPDSDIPRVGANAMSYSSSRVVEDASFLRLKNISLSYSFPEKLIKKSGVLSGVKIYVTGRNLWTVTGFEGYDPEVGYSNATQGMYPNSRQIVFGAELVF